MFYVRTIHPAEMRVEVAGYGPQRASGGVAFAAFFGGGETLSTALDAGQKAAASGAGAVN